MIQSKIPEPKPLTVLLIGNGAREHAICSKLSQSERIGELLVAPGNAGTSLIASNIPIQTNDIDGLLKFAKTKNVDFTVVAPELPLAEGIVDTFQESGINIFGPRRNAALIESSKSFAKTLMLENDIPTGAAQIFSDYEEACQYVKESPIPIVIKADGLAAGKGVTVATTQDEAIKALGECMRDKQFGTAGDSVLVEDYLEGPEVSVFAFVDGDSVSSMVAACDYKRVGEGNIGANTGGMGAYSPPPPNLWNSRIENRVRQEIMIPTASALKNIGHPYVGILYAGIMITEDGPKVIEFNCRLGDPETQVILPRLKTDLLTVMINVTSGNLRDITLEWDPRPCVGIVIASGGYPGEYSTGHTVYGLDKCQQDVQVFHGGTEKEKGGAFKTMGGRVLTVSALGEDLGEARSKAYDHAEYIHFENSFFRHDIAYTESISGK